MLLGIGIGWGLYGNTSSPLSLTKDPGAKADGVAPVVLTPPRQLQSLGGLTGLLEQMRKKFGDTLGYRLVIYPEYAVLDRPDPDDERRTLSYTIAAAGVIRRPDPRAASPLPSTSRRSTPRRSSGCCAARRRRSTSSPMRSRRPT